MNTVLDGLIKIKLSKKDVFLLFGPVDILVQLHFKDPDEFINKWFNPIRAITSQEPMIEKTQTLIVISEGKSFTEGAHKWSLIHLACSRKRRH